MKNEMIEALKAKQQKSNGTYQKVDYKEDFFQMREMGIQKVRILPNENENELFPFFESHSHKLSQKVYHAHEGIGMDRDNCPVCFLLSNLWDDNSSLKQNQYRAIKAQKVYTYNVLLLDENGKQETGKPLLYNMPPSLHSIVVDKMINSNVDVSDISEGFNFNIVRKEAEKNKYYSSSYFDEESTSFKGVEIEACKPLNSGKYFRISSEVLNECKSINNQLSLDLNFSKFSSENTTAAAETITPITIFTEKEVDKDRNKDYIKLEKGTDDISYEEFEEKILKDIIE